MSVSQIAPMLYGVCYTYSLKRIRDTYFNGVATAQSRLLSRSALPLSPDDKWFVVLDFGF